MTDFVTAWPDAFACIALIKSRAIGNDTSASNSATRTSLRAIDTSSSDNVALLFNLSKTPERRSDKFANICQALSAKITSQTQLTPVGETR